MLKVAFRHFHDDAASSGWYICDARGTIVAGTPAYAHHSCAVRALSARLNAPLPV